MLGFAAHTVAANPSADLDGEPTVGWHGNYLIGRWTPVFVPVMVKEAGSFHFSVTAIDPDGNKVQFQSPEVTLDQGHHRLTAMIKVGRLDGEVTVKLNNVEKRGIPGKTEWLKTPLKPSVRMVLTVGEPQGFEFDAESIPTDVVAKVAGLKTDELPVDPLAFDGIASLVIAGDANIAPTQADAIRRWVSIGGRLIVSLRHDPAAARSFLESFGNWVPIRVGNEPATVREFGGLEILAGKKVRIPHSSTLSIPNLQSDTGEVLAASRSDAFVIQAPYGMGSVTVLAMDLTAAPLSEWKALPSLCARLTGIKPAQERQEKTQARSSQLSSTGITDLATQLAAIQDHFEKVQRVSPWFSMGLIAVFLIIVGPIDYLIVGKLFKRTYLTWLTFPAFVLAATFITSLLASASNGTVRRANQLDIVNIDVATATATSKHLVSLYAPSTSQVSIAIDPVPLAPNQKTKPSSITTWSGTPESAFGGMFRESGIELGTEYEQQPDGQLSKLPVVQWSSKALVATSVQSVEGLVDSNLHASATGRLTGTITHRFAGPIEDFMIVYGNVVYRQLKKKDEPHSLPLPPKQVWRVDQSSVYTRELRPFLTGIITMATPRFGSPSNDYTHQQASYDTMSLDPYNVLRILTFHDEIGGERYTTLKNQILEEEDCSQLLRLGRAILFGKLSQPVATIRQDDAPFEPDRQDSFVRLILPVTRSTEVVKELRRVVKE